MRGDKEPLYRKINWRTYHVDNHSNKDANKDRGRKNGVSPKMGSKKHGLDYTPLFKFLLSKIGKKWDDVYSEAVSRLDSKEPITWIMDSERDYFMVGNSYSNTLLVDDNGLIQKVNPNLKNEDFEENCYCCTHTFNGKPLNNKYIQNAHCNIKLMLEKPDIDDVMDYVSIHDGLRERDTNELFSVIIKESTNFNISKWYDEDDEDFIITFDWNEKYLSLFINKEMFSTWNVRNTKFKLLDI